MLRRFSVNYAIFSMTLDVGTVFLASFLGFPFARVAAVPRT